jgi:nucleotide-binding universal stress UspA family protein
MYGPILVPIDGSVCSDKAVEHAIRLARETASPVVFLFVMDTLKEFDEGLMPQIRHDLEVEGRAILDRAEKVAVDAGVDAAVELSEGSPSDVIVRRARDFDLVVMGNHGKGLWKRLKLGSVTQGVLHRVTRPLLVIPDHDGGT